MIITDINYYFCVLSYIMYLRSEFRVLMSVRISALK